MAIVGRPVARALDKKGDTLEVTRVCTQGHPDACSKLYAACQQRARLRGYRKLITYTLQSEKASSVRGANFGLASAQAGGAKWTGKRAAGRASGATTQELKCRWEIVLEPVAPAPVSVRPPDQPWVQRPLAYDPERGGSNFDCVIFPAQTHLAQTHLAQTHLAQADLPVPSLPAQALAGLAGRLPGPERLAGLVAELHALAGLADRAGYQLLLARQGPAMPFYLTTCRHNGGGHRYSMQWCDTELSGGDRLRVYLSAAAKEPLSGALAAEYGSRPTGPPPPVLA